MKRHTKKYTYEDEETFLLDDLIRFCDHNKFFKRKFIDDCYDFMDQYGYITQEQLDILKSIHYQIQNLEAM